MTKLYFRAVPHYEYMLTTLAGAVHDPALEGEVETFAREMQKIWDLNNEKLFTYYKSIGLTLPEAWYVYPIHANGKITPFAEPTTIIIRKNLNEVIATVVHELCHAFCAFDENDKTLSAPWQKILHAYPDITTWDQEHLLIIVLARAGLRHILGSEKAEQLLTIEKGYPGLDQAWKIIESCKSTAYDNPFQFLEDLFKN